MVKYDKQVLILDEPTQGSDPDVAMWVLNNVFTRFNNKTIIMITHMCGCQLKRLGIDWTHQLEITNGIVYEKKHI